jgi:aryl-alcohol dehydrogenase-like predicted oxidoreductase
MTSPPTRRLGTHHISAIGFGAMQLPGPRVFGPPNDRDAALSVLRRAVELGINHIDTAQYYGPDVSNELIYSALHPYPSDLVLVSKVGARRDQTGAWLPANRPEELRAGVVANLASLHVDQLGAVNLRCGNAGEPNDLFDAQVGAMAAMQEAGMIAGVGVSNVSPAQLERARSITEIVCVQNAYNLRDRGSDPVLEACEAAAIAFVPFFPLGSAFGASVDVTSDQAVINVARRLDATPAQVALAWLLARSAQILLIPGTSSVGHLEENFASASLVLDDQVLRELAAPTPAETR